MFTDYGRTFSGFRIGGINIWYLVSVNFGHNNMLDNRNALIASIDKNKSQRQFLLKSSKSCVSSSSWGFQIFSWSLRDLVERLFLCPAAGSDTSYTCIVNSGPVQFFSSGRGSLLCKCCAIVLITMSHCAQLLSRVRSILTWINYMDYYSFTIHFIMPPPYGGRWIIMEML